MKKSNIYKFYYLLASLDLLTIILTLGIAYNIHQVYESSSAKNELWMKRIESYEDMTNLIIESNGPGNSVFENRKIKEEKSRFEKLYSKLLSQLESIKKDNSLNLGSKKELESLIIFIDSELAKGRSNTLMIFRLLEGDKTEEASKYMSQMDTNFHKALVTMSEMKKLLRILQRTDLEKDHNRASTLFKREVFVGVFVFAIIFFILFYGRKLKLQIEESENQLLQKNKELSELQVALDEHSIVAKTDLNGKITYVNKMFCQVSGYTEEELIGKDHRIVNSGYHSKYFFRDLWSDLKSGNKWRGQVKNKSKDGKFYWVDTSITPIKDLNSETTGFYAIRKEITREKEAQKISDEVQKIAKIGGWKLNIQTMETEWTDETYRIHEVQIGTPTNTEDGINFYAEHERERISNLVMNCIQKGEGFEGEFDFITAKGNKRRVHSKGVPEKDKKGNVIAISGTFQDITQRFLNEQELKKQKELALHTSKLASIGQLAAGVGHEINNPLAIVKGYAAAILKKLKSKDFKIEEFESYLEKMNVASTRIEKIVLGLRTFSRLDSDESVYFSPVEATEESFNMVEEIYHRDNIKVVLDKSNCIESIKIKGSRGKFQQLLMNLISNARDALISSSEKNIIISLASDEQKFFLNIEDTGMGIPEKIKDRIFDPFFTTKEVNEGTGIGLSLAYNFVKEMNGELKVESNIGIGSKFFITLPTEIEIIKEKTPKEKTFEALEGHVLLVDDEEKVREILAFYLEDFGLTVTHASNGIEALNLYLKSPKEFDLIITDMMMPEMNGETFIKSIRSEKDLIQPFIICTTGGVDISFEDESLKNLIEGYFYKPFDENKVYEVISKYIGSV